MSGQLDVLVPPLGGAVDAGDQAGAVKASKISVHKGIPRLRVVRRALGQPEMPLPVPGVRFEVGVLRVGTRLDLTPVAVQDVLPGVDEFARLGHRGFVRQVFGHEDYCPATGVLNPGDWLAGSSLMTETLL